MLMLYGKSSAELREQAIEWFFVPLARELMRRHDEYESVVLAVAQYYADNASDETHVDVLPSTARNPSWPLPACEPRRGDWQAIGDRRRVEETMEALWGSPYVYWGASLTVAFASFCVEGVSEGSPRSESYSPFAIARLRSGDEIEVEIVGEMKQPHWEDRFDKPSRQSLPPVDVVRSIEAAFRGGTLSPDELVAIADAPSELARAQGLGHRLLASLEACRGEGTKPRTEHLDDVLDEVARTIRSFYGDDRRRRPR